MIIDKIEHQQFLLEMFKQVSIPGNLIDLAYEVKKSISDAKVENTISSLTHP